MPLSRTKIVVTMCCIRSGVGSEINIDRRRPVNTNVRRSEQFMNNTLESVSRLPMEFHAVGNKSLIQLLDECGYTANPDSVTQTDIEACLSEHSDWCDAWIGYSQDRRTNCGWVISGDDGNYVVHYYPNGNKRLRFQDKAAACAAFAIRELKSLVT